MHSPLRSVPVSPGGYGPVLLSKHLRAGMPALPRGVDAALQIRPILQRGARTSPSAATYNLGPYPTRNTSGSTLLHTHAPNEL